MQKNHQIALLAIVALVVLAGALYFAREKKESSEIVDSKSTSAIVEKVNVDFKEDPEKFPVGFPIESGATLTQNYNATTPAGQFQATKVFVTQVSLDANLKLYTDYFTKNGWEVSGVVDQLTYKSVTGSKDGDSVQVSIDENKTGSKIKTVSITYLEKLNLETK